MDTKSYKVIIPGRLANMNDYTSAQRSNKYKGAKLKHDNQAICEMHIKEQLRGVRCKRVKICYVFYEKDRRRDLDNVSGFAHKVFQDALVTCGVLKDDGWDEIVGYQDVFAVDRKDPRIEVEIMEVE